MRKIKLLFLSLLVSILAFPQATGTVVSGNAVAYQSERHLFRNGNQLSLIALDTEWPKVVDYSKVEELQRYLTSFLFGNEATSFSSGWQTLAQASGEEIHDMPVEDDLEIHHKDIRLKILDYRIGKYISFQAWTQERNATAVTSTKSRYFTFDLINKKILEQEDVFNKYRTWNDVDWRYVFEEALKQYMVIDPMETGELWLDAVPNEFYLKNDALYLTIQGSTERYSYSVLTMEMLQPVLTKKFKKWLNAAPEIHADASLDDEHLLGPNDGIEPKPDSLASFPGGNKRMTGFLADNLAYTSEEGEVLPDRVIVSFIVDEKGNLSDFTILSPVYAKINHCLIATLRVMPKWKPAIRDGKAVRSRVVYPFMLK